MTEISKKVLKNAQPIIPHHGEVELKRAGLKITLPRLKVLKLLEETSEPHHVTAEDVYRLLLAEGAEVGLATVYRVLTQFEQAGIVTRHHFDGGQALFELNTGDNHDHMVCQTCGKVAEFKDAIIEERLQQLAAERGFDINEYRIIVYGAYQCSGTQCQ